MVTNKQKEDAPEKQMTLLEVDESWKEHFKGMPSFKQQDCMPYKSIIVHFDNRNHMLEFSKLVKQRIDLTTKYIWYPESEIAVNDMKWVSEEDDDTEIIEDEP